MKPMRQVEPLETIWEIPDDLWEKVEPVILEGTPPKTTGRKRVNPRPILNGVWRLPKPPVAITTIYSGRFVGES